MDKCVNVRADVGSPERCVDGNTCLHVQPVIFLRMWGTGVTIEQRWLSFIGLPRSEWRRGVRPGREEALTRDQMAAPGLAVPDSMRNIIRGPSRCRGKAD
ncbi:hypothetical protein AAFF_G00301390 [Aldrovandia affinis]|uniref:Uncharacterized protein n=1 Tax=Aldrovandia affinis TaxID=143900 RepID=A0AAD7SPU5_9TELE|nr:hypothetical protein AAFF_G00301390 [Aldrovandia affinis]